MRKTRNHKLRHRTAKWIEAVEKLLPIQGEVVSVEWIAAADDDKATSPKRFSMMAYTGGPIQVNYYGAPVVIDLSGINAKSPIPILRDHNISRVVGHADEVDISGDSIRLAGVISGAGTDAAEVQAAAGNGFPWKASVGVRPDKLEFVGEGVATKVNGKTFTGPLYVARKSTLGETSFVAIGADRKATAKVAATAAQYKESDMNFTQWVEALGFVFEELREDQKQHLKAKYDAEVEAAKVKADSVEGAGKDAVVNAPRFDLSGVILAHEKHIGRIEAIGEQYRSTVPNDKFAEVMGAARKKASEAKLKALNEEWPTAKLEAEHIKAAAHVEADMMMNTRPKGPAIHASQHDLSWPAIEAAFCRTAGIKDMDKQFAPEVLEASDYYRNLGVNQLIMVAAQANGYTGRQWIDNGNYLEVMRAAFTTHNITTMLTQAGNKVLLDGFNMAPGTWREVAATRSVRDFKQVTAFRMTESLEYKEIGPGGEFHHGALGQETYTMQAKTYGRMLALTRQDIINDDLGAFDMIRTRLGMYAAMTISKVFWTAWLAAVNGAAFWTSARGNYQSGAATVLGEPGLNTAAKLFRDQKAPKPAGADATDAAMRIAIEPTKLIVPSDLEATARKLYVSQEMRDTTASTKTMTSNIYYNRFRPIIVPELSDSGYTGYSATHWGLCCDPSILATFHVCFLNGVQAPTVEATDAEFETLGIKFRGYHDFGVDSAEYRASVWSAGA